MGWPRLTRAGRPVAVRSRRLLFLTYLALEGPVERRRLAAAFWDGQEPEAARSRLRLELHRIARSDLRDAVVIDGETVAVQLTCDAVALADAVRAGRWAEVADLARGPLLAEAAVDVPALQAWLEAARARYAGWARDSLEQLAGAADRAGDAPGALEAEQRLLDLDPYSEEVCARVLARLHALGRVQDAATLEARFRIRYRDELGAAPRLPSSAQRSPLTPERPAARRPSLEAPPFVGRDATLRALDAWAQTAARVALLTGEAGVGKTRLAHEWTGRRGERALVLRGSQLGQGVPFSVVGECLHHIGEARLQALAPVWRAELASVWPDLAPDQRARPASNLPRLLEAVSEALYVGLEGTLIVLDDLHWFDPSSVQAVAHALNRWRLPGPLRILATARPGELNSHGPVLAWLDDLERSVTLTRTEVPPLTEMSVLNLIRQLSGSHQATGFARKLHALSGGNAYALLAFLQGLIERDVLRAPEEEHLPWTLTVDLDHLDRHLPSTLRDRLVQAVSGAGRPALRWMETAALLAPPFDFQAVQAGSGLTEDDALTALEQATAHRWIEAADPAGYRVRHDLLRHALQHQLQRERKRVVHGRVAAHLIRTAGAPAQVAHHLQQAGDRSGAVPYWLDATQQAEAVWAHEEVLDTLAHALECEDDANRRTDLHLRRCQHFKALNDLGGWDAELGLLAATLQGTSEASDTQRLAYVRERTHLLWRSGDHAQALAFSEPWSHGAVTPERTALLHDRAVILYRDDRTGEALKILETALADLDPAWTRLEANLHNALVLCCLELGLIRRGLAHAEHAIELFGNLQLRDGLASAHANQALIHAALDDRAAQRHALETALRHATEAQNIHLQRQCLESCCDIATEDGDWPRAATLATRGLELSELMTDHTGIQDFQARLTRLRSAHRPPPTHSNPA
ncbi:ATP-binding protein [Deinococcus aquiradiocola]|nr:AAA family ATPase [Deinococcus aquiradiocola]